MIDSVSDLLNPSLEATNAVRYAEDTVYLDILDTEIYFGCHMSAARTYCMCCCTKAREAPCAYGRAAFMSNSI